MDGTVASGTRMTLDSLLFNAGTLFFALWSVVIAAVSVAAFGQDFFPPKEQLESTPKPHASGLPTP
jgi:hypothetical protein